MHIIEREGAYLGITGAYSHLPLELVVSLLQKPFVHIPSQLQKTQQVLFHSKQPPYILHISRGIHADSTNSHSYIISATSFLEPLVRKKIEEVQFMTGFIYNDETVKSVSKKALIYAHLAQMLKHGRMYQ